MDGVQETTGLSDSRAVLFFFFFLALTPKPVTRLAYILNFLPCRESRSLCSVATNLVDLIATLTDRAKEDKEEKQEP